MIENLYVHNPQRNVHHTVLRDLGKVSVLCGRNNSGKTSLLESVRDASTSRGQQGTESRAIGAVGVRMADALAGELGSAISHQAQQHSWSLERARGQVERAWVNELVTPETIGDGVERIGPFHGYSNLQTTVSNVLTALMSRVPSRLLVPAKRLRQPESEYDPEIFGEITPEGGNLLSYLFAAKNQEEGSTPHTYYSTLRHHFGTVSEGFDFDVILEGKTLTLKLRPLEGSWENAESFGLGLHDVLLILAVALSCSDSILLIEEPENHVHPAMQRRLLQVLRASTENQYLISTHSNVFLDNAFVDRVYFTEFANGEVRVSDVTSKASLLDDLGYQVTDNLTADVVVLTEGPTDVPVLETLALKRDDLRLKQIKFWPLGGDIMTQLDLSVLTDSNNVVALVDDDPGSKRVRDRFAKMCEDLGVPCHRLERYAIENYFTVDALREVFGGQVSDEVKSVRPRAKLEKQLGFNVKKRNRSIAEAMTYADIEGTDLDAFFSELAKLCR